MMLEDALTAAPAMPDITKAATTAPVELPAQAPTMKTANVDHALVMSQSVRPATTFADVYHVRLEISDVQH